MKISAVNKFKNVIIYIRIIETIIFILSVILMLDVFNNAIIFNYIINNFDYSIIQYTVEISNIIFLTAITVVLYYNCASYSMINRYALPVFLTIVLSLEVYRFISESSGLIINLILMLIFLSFFVDNFDYKKIDVIDKKWFLIIVSLTLIIIAKNQILFNKEFSFYEGISSLSAVIIVLIFYKTLKYKGINYSVFIGLLIMVNVFLIVVHKSTIDYKVFIFSYHILKFMSFVSIYLGIYYYNWEKNHESLSQREKQIKLYAKKINSVVKKRTTEIERMNKRLNDDLEYARIIQQSLLPSKEVDYSAVRFISNYYPCEKLSGDFYDIFRIDNQNMGMYILDVSGHGVSAAMLTMFCKNAIISGERLIRRYRGLKPHRNLQHFYDVFNEADFPPETYMVMFFASYNVDTHVLKYSSGGMNCIPIVIKKDGNLYELSENQGFPISKIGEFYTPEYSTTVTMLNKGDSVFFYTDGLTDFNKNKILDYNGLITLLKEEKTVERINNSLDEMIQKNKDKLDDDITYFIMEVK